MVLSLSYRRPAHVSRESVDTEKTTTTGSYSEVSSCPYGIPDALSFDRIISGGTCPVSIDDPIVMRLLTYSTARHYPGVYGFLGVY